MSTGDTLHGWHDGPRGWVYALIALGGMLLGLALGQIGRHAGGGSRIQWPAPVPQPRSLNP